MQLKRLHSEPEIFDPIEFQPGLNIITGERLGDSKAGNKTNGVGKTLCIHFLDFCLLSDYAKNRISKVPTETLGDATDIILEISSNSKNIAIRRNVKNYDTPTIYVDGTAKPFSSVIDARKYLFKCLFPNDFDCSFRQIIRAFKRTENIGYNSIDNPDGVIKDPTPYLHLFGLNVDLHQTVLEKAQALIDAYKYDKELVKDIERLDISVNEASAYVNDLKAQLQAIDEAVENLSQHEVYETISDDISNLDEKLETANLHLVSIKEEIKQIDKIPEFQNISHDDIMAVYNDCKNGLGDLIVREIDEIQEFKKIIDTFKNEVLSQRRDSLFGSKEKTYSRN